MSTPNARYRREIDGLRAVAVLSVILYHAGYDSFRGGYVGVDVFFVISGYLITRLICDQVDTRTFSYRRFLERRARRVIPALLFVAAVSIPFAWIWLLPNDFVDYSQSLLAIPLMASNVVFWRESGYFDPVGDLKPMLHTWSLAVEEQFYLLFPLSILALAKHGRGRVVAGVGLLASGSFLLSRMVASRDASAAFYLLPTRAWELLVGALLALHLSRRVGRSSRPLSEVGGAIGIGLIILAILMFDQETSSEPAAMLVPVIGTALVLACSSPDTRLGKLLGSKTFVGVGLVSYSAYLWHHLLFSFARHGQFFDEWSLVPPVLILATFVLSVLTWKTVEQPFRNHDVISLKVFLGSLGLAALCISILGGAAIAKDGFPSRIKNEILYEIFASDADNRTLFNENCLGNFPQFIDAGACLMSKSEAPTMVLMGDSHSQQYYEAVADAFPDDSVLNVAYLSCRPFLSGEMGDDQSECDTDISMLYNFVLRTPTIKTVIITGYWKYLVSGSFSKSDYRFRLAADPTPEAGEDFSEIGVSSVKALQHSDRRVILIDDNPEMDFDIRSCASQLAGKTDNPRTVCGVSREVHELRRSTYLRYLTGIVNATGIEVIFPSEVLCDSDFCFALKDDALYYEDSDHLSNLGAKLVVSQLLVPLIESR